MPKKLNNENKIQDAINNIYLVLVEKKLNEADAYWVLSYLKEKIIRGMLKHEEKEMAEMEEMERERNEETERPHKEEVAKK